MIYSGYELLWLFFICSFLGWVLETAAGAVKQKRFINRGLVNLPLCVIYGIGEVLVTVFCQELTGFWLFGFGMVAATVLEWSAGHLIERLYHERWWDYSGRKWNLDGYICLSSSVLWGVFSWGMITWGNELLLQVFHWIPGLPGKILDWVLLGLLILDCAATMFVLSGRSRHISRWEAVDQWLDGISGSLERKICRQVDARIRKAYPQAEVVPQEKVDTHVFAGGCGFYKISLLFLLGAFLGDITETIFCRVTAGVWMSRSSVVWGPFSIVWGLAIAAATLLLYKYKDRSDSFLFLSGTVLGGVYEYLCSVFTEIVFGTVFWDYSDIPFNLGGRINLLYCFFWGFAAVIWMKVLYPPLSSMIEKLSIRFGKIQTWILVVFMCINMAVSAMALGRSNERREGILAEHTWQKIMDERFDDQRLNRIYPNALER